MKYACLVYKQVGKTESMTDQELDSHIAECVAWTSEVEGSGRHVNTVILQSERSAATVRVRNDALSVTDGPFAETKEVLGGLTIIEARDLNEAIQMVAKLDCARVGSVEVRPVLEQDAELGDPEDRRIASFFRDRLAECAESPIMRQPR